MEEVSGTRRTAWVTGGAGGIGRAVCEHLASDGFDVTVFDVNRPSGPGVRWITWNALDHEQSSIIVGNMIDEESSPDALVLCAGIAANAPLHELPLEVWDKVLSVNLTAPMLFLQLVLPAMVARGSGAVVAITSGVALRPTRGSAAYAASKAGLTALIKVAALEGAAANVTANLVSPGITNTPMVRAARSRNDLEELARSSPIANPMGVVLDPHDIASAVAYLCSSESRRITGQTLHVNAGSIMP